MSRWRRCCDLPARKIPDEVMLPLAGRLHRYLIPQEHIGYVVYPVMKVSSGHMKCSEEIAEGSRLESARCEESNEVLKWWEAGPC